MVLTSILFFFVGSVVAAVAKNFTYMLVGRSIQGVGGGGVIALSEVIVTDLVPLRLRGQYFGILSSMWSIGSVTGPILGGGFSQNVTWVSITAYRHIGIHIGMANCCMQRWIFYINFPFIGVGGIFVLLFLKLKFLPTSLAQKLRQIDYIGTVLFVGSISSFLIPLTWGGVLYPWDSWRTLVPLIIGVVGLLIFSIYEYRFATDPIIPPTLFQNLTASVSYAQTVLQGLTLWCALYYLPLYYEAVKGYSPVLSGVALFPQSFTVAPSAIIVGLTITRTGRYRWAIWSGWTISVLGMGLLCYMKPDTSVPGWIFLNLVSGLGLGILFPSLTFAIQASATPENLAMAVGMFAFFRALGQAFGVAVGGVVFQNQMFKNLLRYPGLAEKAAAYSADAAGLVQIIKAMPEGVEKVHLREAYTDSLRIVWAVCCGICGVGLLLGFFIKGYDLDAALTTNQGLRSKGDVISDEEKS